MTDAQINEAVARELGWTVTHRGWWGKEGHPTEAFAPDFCTDHNAAAEMREAVQKGNQTSFARRVADLAISGEEDCRSAYYWSIIDSTPRQQAEAFLRMRGKWVEEGK